MTTDHERREGQWPVPPVNDPRAADPLQINELDMKREPLSRWPLLWQLYGLPRCSQASYPESAPHCWRLIWPWQPREVRNGHPVHAACLTESVR
jgi:hypothetical protein